jgi:meiosis induction protein kinase IME2/SME1
MQKLSLGSPQWQNQHHVQPPDGRMQQGPPSLITLSPAPSNPQPSPTLPRNPPDYTLIPPPSPGVAPKSAINPIFKVVSVCDFSHVS